MKIINPKYVLVLSAALIFSVPAFSNLHAEVAPMKPVKAATTEIVRKASPHSVSATMDKFEAIVKKKDFEVFARIDHQKNAEGAELKMAPAQVIIFGNPNGGTLLMNTDIRVSLDLPLRVAVYQDADDKVYIAYHAPMAMSETYDLEGHKVIAKLNEGLDKLTAAAIAE